MAQNLSKATLSITAHQLVHLHRARDTLENDIHGEETGGAGRAELIRPSAEFLNSRGIARRAGDNDARDEGQKKDKSQTRERGRPDVRRLLVLSRRVV